MSTPAEPLSTAATPATAGLGDALRRRVTGVVHVPGEPGYDAARTPWNVAADQRSAAVVVPQHADDVAAVLRVAAEAGLRVAPQGTGHAAASLPALDGAILLLTTALGRVTVDPPTPAPQTTRSCWGMGRTPSRSVARLEPRRTRRRPATWTSPASGRRASCR